MDKDSLDLISKDVEFVKDTVIETNKRINNLEESVSSFQRDFAEHIATDRQLVQEISRIGNTLERNTESLAEHMRRTELNELSIEQLKELNLKIDSRLKPLEEASIEKAGVMKFAAKLGAFIGVAVAVATLVYKLLGYDV